jgi:LPS sulfotransferase NodH
MKYLILSSPRTGSTALCHALEATGVAGAPREYFHRKRLNAASNPEKDIRSLKNYFDEVVVRNTTPNGVFGMKLHYNQFQNLFGDQRHGLAAGIRFLRQFQKFILIFRRDKILQAISELLAMESRVWVSGDKQLEHKVGRAFQGSDAVKITRIMARQLAEEYGWRDLSAGLGIAFLEVAYEDLIGGTSRALVNITSHLDIAELNDLKLSERTVKTTNAVHALQMKNQYMTAMGYDPGEIAHALRSYSPVTRT